MPLERKRKMRKLSLDQIGGLTFLAIASIGVGAAISHMPYSFNAGQETKVNYSIKRRVPAKIMLDYINNGGLNFLGDYEKTHAFLKGEQVSANGRVRQMYNVEKELQSRGWSDKEIHDVGSRLGVSEPYNLDK